MLFDLWSLADRPCPLLSVVTSFAPKLGSDLIISISPEGIVAMGRMNQGVPVRHKSDIRESLKLAHFEVTILGVF